MADAGNNRSAIREGRIGALKVQEHPDLKARNRNNVGNGQPIASSSCQLANSCPGAIEAFVLVSIKNAVNVVVSALFAGALFRAFHNADRRRTLRVVSNDDLRGRQIEMAASHFKVSLFRLALADDERDGPRRLAPLKALKGFAPSDIRYSAASQGSIPKGANHWHGAVSTLEIATFQGLIFSRAVLQKWINLAGLPFVFGHEPHLIPPKQLCVQ